MRLPVLVPAEKCSFSRPYPGSTEYLSRVRADLRVLLDCCPAADDVVLCASELAANAAVHSDSRLHGGEFVVRARVRPGDYVRVEVEDGGGHWAEPTRDQARSHGLDIIRVLADDWGIDGDHRGRTVWARFDWRNCD